MNSKNNLHFKFKYENQKDILKFNSKFTRKRSQKKINLNKEKLSKLDKKNYHKALFHKCHPKKSQSMKDFSKSNIYNDLGHYTNLFNGNGGFCKRIENNNSKNYALLYINNEIYDNNFQKYINSRNNDGYLGNPNIFYYNGKSDSNYKYIAPIESKRRNSSKTTISEKNNVKKNKKKVKSEKIKISKININKVFKNIKDLQLNSGSISDDKRIVKKKEETLKENNSINIFNDINETKNKEINDKFLNELLVNKISDKEKKNKYNNNLIKQSNDQFSMNNNKIKKFGKLIEINNVLLNYLPTINFQEKNNLNNKLSFKNFSITSHNIEYNIIKKSKPITSLEEKITNKSEIKNENVNDNTLKENNTIHEKKNEKNNENNNIMEEMQNKNKNKDNINDKDNNKFINPYLNKIIIYKKKSNSNIINNNDNKNALNNPIDNKANINLNNNNKNNNEEKNKFSYNANKKNDNFQINDNSNQNINKKKDIINNNIKNETNIKLENENKIINEEEKSSKPKNSKQFLKFKSRLVKKLGSELQKEGNKLNISEKITNLALELENKLKNGRPTNMEENNKQEINNNLNSIELIEQKPIHFNKKKAEKVVFSYN